MKISKERTKIFMLFFIVLMPELFTQIKPVFYVFSISAVCIFVYYLYYFIVNKNLRLYMMLWLFSCLYLLLMMVLNKNISDIDLWGKSTIFVSDLIFLLEYYIKKGNSKEILSVISTLGIFMLLVNTISFIFFPNGLIHTIGGNYYFLGTRNHFIKYFFAFIVISGLQSIYYKKRTNIIITLILSVIQFIYFQVSTAITCIILLCVLLLFKDILKQKLNMKKILIVTTIISVSFVFFNAANTFSWFIVNFLHKDIGLNSRSLIWTEAIRIISSDKVRFIFGNGLYNDGNFIYLYELYWPAHNQLLEWLFEYGLFGTGILYLFFIKLDNKTKCGYDSYFVLSVCFIILVASISSGPLSTAPGYMALFLLPHINSFRRDATYIE